MITGAISGLITAILAAFGVKPTPWLFGAIWLVLKFCLFMAVFFGLNKIFEKKKAPAQAEAPVAVTEQPQEE